MKITIWLNTRVEEKAAFFFTFHSFFEIVKEEKKVWKSFCNVTNMYVRVQEARITADY